MAGKYINVEELAKRVAIETVKEYDRQKKDSAKKRVFRNTGILLDNYIDFVDCYNNIQYKASDIVEALDLSEFELMDLDEIFIESIKRSKVRTMLIINQIKTCMDMLKEKMQKKNELEKYEVIEKLYMKRDNVIIKFCNRVELVAKELNCSESTVRRWNNEMVRELSKQLFGYDGLRIDI